MQTELCRRLRRAAAVRIGPRDGRRRARGGGGGAAHRWLIRELCDHNLRRRQPVAPAAWLGQQQRRRRVAVEGGCILGIDPRALRRGGGDKEAGEAEGGADLELERACAARTCRLGVRTHCLVHSRARLAQSVVAAEARRIGAPPSAPAASRSDDRRSRTWSASRRAEAAAPSSAAASQTSSSAGLPRSASVAAVYARRASAGVPLSSKRSANRFCCRPPCRPLAARAPPPPTGLLYPPTGLL